MADGKSSGYEVGYGKPPGESRFKPGQSGNPKGRKRGVKNTATVFQDELNVRVPISENGNRKIVSKREAIVKQTVNKAASGDPKAIRIVLDEERANTSSQSHLTTSEEAFSVEDELVMSSIVRRIRETYAVPTSSESASQQNEPASQESENTKVGKS